MALSFGPGISALGSVQVQSPTKATLIIQVSAQAPAMSRVPTLLVAGKAAHVSPEATLTVTAAANAARSRSPDAAADAAAGRRGERPADPGRLAGASLHGTKLHADPARDESRTAAADRPRQRHQAGRRTAHSIGKPRDARRRRAGWSTNRTSLGRPAIARRPRAGSRGRERTGAALAGGAESRVCAAARQLHDAERTASGRHRARRTAVHEASRAITAAPSMCRCSTTRRP